MMRLIIAILLPLVYSKVLLLDQIMAKSVWDISKRIIGGTKATPGQFPYQVYLRYVTDGGYEYFICGGTILTGKWVVTAGHCLYGENAQIMIEDGFLKVVAGVTEITPYHMAEHKRAGLRVVVHPKHSHRYPFRADIALVEVDYEWSFDTNLVKPIRHLDYSLPANSTCIVSGWGQTETGPTVHLLYAQEYLYDNDFCNTKISRDVSRFRFTKETLCAGNLDNYSGPCHGDSGGPLVCDNRLTGVVSGSAPAQPSAKCGDIGLPNIYVSVNYYWSWIQTEMNKPRSNILFDSNDSNDDKNSTVKTSKTHKLHGSLGIVNLMFILYRIIV